MMHSNEQGIQLPIDEEIIFTNFKGEQKEKIKKRQMKLMSKLDFLKPFLLDNEVIKLVTVGTSPISIIDYLFTGAAIYYLKRCILIFTNKRIIHVPTKYNLKYRNSIAQILYEDCNSLSIKMGRLIIEYKTSKVEKFIGIPIGERKKLKSILNDFNLVPGLGTYRTRIHLCPQCGSVLDNNNFICQKCRLEFKDKSKGKRLSILYPGGGYFYTRHPILGIGDAITEMILLFIVIIFFIDLILGVEDIQPVLILFSILLIIEKAVTIYHSNHFINEFIPIEKGTINKIM